MAEPIATAGMITDDAQFRLALLDHQRKQRIISGVILVASIAATAIPLMVVNAMVDDLAGEETTVSVNLALTISVMVSLALTGVSGALLLKMRQQKKELVRLRQQISDLEREVPAMQERRGQT